MPQPPCPAPRPALALAALVAGCLAVAPGVAAEAESEQAPLSGREARCLALIAFAEAASEGADGMAAVIRVVRNRMKHGAFPAEACAVVAQEGQFQPIEQSSTLQKVVRDPEGYDLAKALGATGGHARGILEKAHELARRDPGGRDPTGGALYFVNPLLMDAARCPWFARLKRTATIGGHVFMTHYRDGEPRGGAALDCSEAGTGTAARKGPGLARQYAVGPFHPDGPRVTSRTVTPAMLRAWKRTGQLAARQKVLQNMFRPGWYRLE